MTVEAVIIHYFFLRKMEEYGAFKAEIEVLNAKLAKTFAAF